MSNVVINVIPKPITSGSASAGKKKKNAANSPTRLSVLYSGCFVTAVWINCTSAQSIHNATKTIV